MTQPGRPPARFSAPLLVALVGLALLAPLTGCLERANDLVPGGSADAEPDPFLVTVTGPGNVLAGHTARFHASADGVPEGTAFWFWDFGDGVEHEGVDLRAVEHTFAEAGAYEVTLTVVDADGGRGVTSTRVGVEQEYAFEGSVSHLELVGSREYAATFPARPELARVTLDVTLERPSPAFAVLEPTPPEIVLRVRAPAADGAGEGPVVLEERILLQGESTRVVTEAPGSGFPHAGDGTLEVEAVDGSTHFTIELVTRYAADAA